MNFTYHQSYIQHQKRQCISAATSSGQLKIFRGDMTKFNAFIPPSTLNSCRHTPSPPSYPMERKFKKPLMEKKRRARMNLCFDQLKELLLQSDLQQSSKLEKADVLEKTVAYLRNLQQENRTLHGQIQQILHSEQGQTYNNGMREGFSICAAATSDILGKMPLPPPFSAPEFRNVLRQDIGDRLGMLLGRLSGAGAAAARSSPPTLTPGSSTSRNNSHQPTPTSFPPFMSGPPAVAVFGGGGMIGGGHASSSNNTTNHINKRQCEGGRGQHKQSSANSMTGIANPTPLLPVPLGMCFPYAPPPFNFGSGIPRLPVSAMNFVSTSTSSTSSSNCVKASTTNTREIAVDEGDDAVVDVESVGEPTMLTSVGDMAVSKPSSSISSSTNNEAADDSGISSPPNGESPGSNKRQQNVSPSPTNVTDFRDGSSSSTFNTIGPMKTSRSAHKKDKEVWKPYENPKRVLF